MLGLAIIALFVAYIVFSAVAIWLTTRWARKHNRRPWLWGGVSAFAMYSLVFWDWVPTLAMHKFYCESDAGFWIYKTPDQWKAENPVVAESLFPNDKVQTENGAYVINKRFRWAVSKTGPHAFNLWRHEQQVRDIVTGEVMARYVDFSTGYGNPMVVNYHGLKGLKFWLVNEHCPDGGVNQDRMGGAMLEFKRIGGSNDRAK